MIRYRHSVTSSCVILVLICALVPKPARAEDKSQGRPIRLYATAEQGPIGKVYSFGAFLVDGRPIFGELTIWGGELIQTAASSSVSVNIDGVGRITLKNSTTARLATTLTRRDDAGQHQVFVASLIDGDMTVKLEQDALAYIESGGSAFASSRGASFFIRTRNGRALLDISMGEVDVQTSRRRTTIKATTVRLDPNRRPVSIGAAPLDRKTGQTAQASSQWRKYYEGTGTSGQLVSRTPRIVLAGYEPAQQPARTEEPAAKRTVLFHLEPPTLGVVDPQGVTDDQGVVTVTFTAARTEGSGQLVGEIVPDAGDPPGTVYEIYRRPVNVTKLFWTRTKIWTAAGAVAAATVCVVACGPKTKPIQQAPPPIIK
jgi:hypothetical protein